MGATLKSLYEALRALDADSNHELDGIAYDLTTNNELGFNPKDPAEFHVGIPFGSPWPAKPADVKLPVESALKAAFLQILVRGISSLNLVIEAKLDPILASNKQVFIDITFLDGIKKEFFCDFGSKIDPADPNNLAHAIGAQIDMIPADYTPVIRCLIGSFGKLGRTQVENDLAGIFWPNGKCVVKKHDKAQLHVGYYSPNFTAKLEDIQSSKQDLENLAQLGFDMVTQVKKVLEIRLSPQELAPIDEVLAMFKKDQVIKNIVNQVAPAISWNHAKIVAVHGQTLLTGGGNFWPEYADGQKDISDLQCKINGDATLSAHQYCDFLWKYLNGKHSPDDRSWRTCVPLKGPISKWDPNVTVPAFGKRPKKDKANGKAVLAVAKIGDWVGQMEAIRYPVQAIDAIRDVALELIYHKLNIMMPTTSSTTGVLLQKSSPWELIRNAVNDIALKSSLKTAKVTPAAWASRSVRADAIHQAKAKVYIDAEIIGGFLQKDSKQWNDFVKNINENKFPKGSEWDGILWPYELIAAMSNFMQNVDVSDPSKGNGLYILLTAPEAPANVKNPPHAGWGDLVHVERFKDRIKTMAVDNKNDSLDSMESWFQARCQIKRTSLDRTLFNHTKAYCVDKKLLYVGSDNPYPNYNEEHGVWIDDQATIEAWYQNSWVPRWSDNWAKKA